MENLIPVSITIADRTLRIKVNPAEEETIRKSVKTINDKVLEFKQHFAGKDMQDYVTMALVWYATQPAQNLQMDVVNDEAAEAIQKLEAQLDKGLDAIRQFNTVG